MSWAGFFNAERLIGRKIADPMVRCQVLSGPHADDSIALISFIAVIKLLDFVGNDMALTPWPWYLLRSSTAMTNMVASSH